MKEKMKKLSVVLKTIFGYGVMISLFVGGATFFGYVVALITGGSVAVQICNVIYTLVIPVVVYLSSVMVLLGLLAMYLGGELALTAQKKEKTK